MQVGEEPLSVLLNVVWFFERLLASHLVMSPADKTHQVTRVVESSLGRSLDSDEWESRVRQGFGLLLGCLVRCG